MKENRKWLLVLPLNAALSWILEARKRNLDRDGVALEYPAYVLLENN